MQISSNPGIEEYITNSCNLVCATDLALKLTCASSLWKKTFPQNGIYFIYEHFKEDKSIFFQAAEQILKGEFPKKIEVIKVYQNETHQKLNLSFYPYFQGAEISGYLVAGEEIKLQLPSLESLEIVNKKFNDAFHYSAIGMAIISLSGKWVDVNRKVCEMVGYSSQKLKTISFQEMTHPDDLHKDLRLLEQMMQGEIDNYQIQKRYYHKKGHLVWVNLSVTMVRDHCNSPSYFVSQIEDISIMKKAQETIRENENIFKGIFHSSYQFTALLSTDGKIIEINNAALGFFGLTMKEAVGKPFHELPNWDNSPQNIETLLKNIQNAASGKFINSEEKLWDNNKKKVRIDFTLKPVLDEQQKVVSLVAEGKIIQEIIDARIKLHESEQKLRLFYNLSPVAFVVSDLETGNFIDFNDAFIHNTGYSREEFFGFNYWKLLPEEYRWMEDAVIEAMRETGFFGPIELEYQHRDGTRFPILVNGMMTRDREGKEQIWSVVQDIGQLKQKEQELEKLNKEIEAQNQLLTVSNDELAQFAYVASHDLQEPLRMITGFLTLLKSKYESQLDKNANEYIHFAVDGAVRMRQIIVDILEYSKIDKNSSEVQTTDIEKVVKNILQLFSGMIQDKKADISWKTLPEIMAQKVPVQQLFSNILSNALKYQQPGTLPKIEISFVELEDKWQFCISDNGIGIRKEFHEKIFTLFSRLNGKREYEGTGIGLALCRKIVEKHGGKIWVESEPDQGSKFYFTLAK